MNKYLVTTTDHPPFTTNEFDFHNHWVRDSGMMVVYLPEMIFTVDGVNWHKIKSDTL